ncbi:MAG: hypothetical protein DMF50_08395 [Acidobacteria bacterium]|nr:MAG: hypothetical protein DMF50_08395 [Acidobacteriota bacterium]
MKTRRRDSRTPGAGNDRGRLAAAIAAAALGTFLSGAPLRAQTTTPIFVELKSPDPVVVARARAAAQGKAFDEAQQRSSIRLAQDQLLQGLVTAGIPYTLTSTTLVLSGGSMSLPDRYADLINAVRLEVGGWDVGKIRRMSAVKHISVDVGKQLALDHSVPYIRANCPSDPSGTPSACGSARSLGLRGTGQVIAVLDTGIHAGAGQGAAGGHPMLDDRVDDAHFEDRNAFTHPDTRPVRMQGEPFLQGVHHTKVVYRAIYGGNAVAGDDTGHGTLVSTTAAGLKARTGPNDGSVVVEGVAPGALLMDYKVCPSLACTDQQILFSLEDSIRPVDVAGNPKPVATVVNMSFGDSTGDPDDAIGTAAGNLQFAGVVPEASAGNDGPSENIIGSPAAHRLVLATAATTDPGVAPNSIDVLNADRTTIRPGTPKMLADFAPESNGTKKIGASIVENYVYAGFADTPADVPPAVSGRICLAQRGGTVGLFGAKANNCAALGAIAVVIFNNVPGPIGVVLAPSVTVPVFTISQEDGLLLRDGAGLGFDAGGVSNLPIRINPEDAALFVPDTAAFSSRGPNNDFRVVKPDITAPGVAILMGASPTGIPVILGDPDFYNSADGTSFSGPHLSGSAALVRDALARPGFAPSQVRAALMNGATNLRRVDGAPIADTDANNFIHETGAGLADLVRAVTVKALLGTNNLNGPGGPDDPAQPDFLPSHSFGELGLIGTGASARSASQRRAITVTLADVSGTSSTYALSLVDAGALRGDITRPLATPGFSVSLGKTSVSVGANGRATFDVNLAVDGTATGLQVAGPDVNGDPAVEFLWYVIAARSDGSETLRMPFFARFAKGPGAAAGKASGDGWIAGSGAGQKANFHFNARFEGSSPAGRIRYESGGGLSLTGDVRTLSVDGAQFRASFGGVCTLGDGSPCQYTADVEDNGEPGNGADRFTIRVTRPGGASAHSNDGLLGGGNIRIGQ